MSDFRMLVSPPIRLRDPEATTEIPFRGMDYDCRWRAGAYFRLRAPREYPGEYGHLPRFQVLYGDYGTPGQALSDKQRMIWSVSANTAGKFWIEPEGMTDAERANYLPAEFLEDLARRRSVTCFIT